jgi:thioredoxin 1
MAFDPQYHEPSLSREELEAMSGPLVLEFGANWCGICGAFSLQAEEVFEDFPHVKHIRVEDGPGKRLGRTFRVKLWPTFVFLSDGQVLGQVSRPTSEQLRDGLQQITAK